MAYVWHPNEADNYVWDVGLLEWVPEQQGVVDGGSIVLSGTVDVSDRAARQLGIVTSAQPSAGVAANVTGDGTSKVIQAANANRKGWSVFNDSGVTVYLKLSSGASATSFKVKLVDQSYYALPAPVYTGDIYALWASGSVRVSEES